MQQTYRLPSPVPGHSSDAPGSVSSPMTSSLNPDADGWVYTDACVLAAIRVTGTPEEPATLADVIAAGDFLHHLILSPQEIEHAVGRLVAAMLITVDERGLAITPLGREVVARARGGTVNRNEALLAILNLLRVRPVPWNLDLHEYEAACLEHRHRFWKAYGRRSRGPRF
jgi:hypothetical protein